MKKFSFLLMLLFFGTLLYSQEEDCYQIPTTVIVENLGQREISSFLCGNDVYLSIPELFSFLRIKIDTVEKGYLEGFVQNQKDLFIIDAEEGKVLYRNNLFQVPISDFVQTETDLLIKAQYLETIFSLEVDIRMSDLSVHIIPKFELTAVKAAKRRQMRRNIRRINRIYTADTTILRDRPVFHPGVFSWALSSLQNSNNLFYNRLNLGMGAIVAGGEFIGNFQYSTTSGFSQREQFYRWRFVDNTNAVVKQVAIGKIATGPISSLFDPVLGINVTNRSTRVKKSFGSYSISDYTKPNWMVELYHNGILVDYIQADMSGYFHFEVPLSYGSNRIQLKFFGPWGEENISTKAIVIPYNFLPEGKFDYNISAGIVQDDQNSKIVQARADYGFTSRVTVGGGMEYLSRLSKTNPVTFATTSIRFPGNFLFSGMYMYKIGYKANLSFSTPSNFRILLNYKKYREGQEAIRYGYQEERLMSLSLPVNSKIFSGSSRLAFRQYLTPENTYTYSEWYLNGRSGNIRFNAMTTAYFNRFASLKIFSKLSTSVQLLKGLDFSPSIEYQYKEKTISAIQAELRKQFSDRITSYLSYSRNFKYDQYSLNFGLNIDLGVSRVGLNSIWNGNSTTFHQSVAGSMIYEPRRNFVRIFNRSVAGLGSVKFVPFLDINDNGQRDGSETVVKGIRIRGVTGGIAEEGTGGSTVFTALEPYLNYHFELDTREVDRISWRVEKKTWNVMVNPNSMREIEIPVRVLGEVTGFVLLDRKGFGGIKIFIKDDKGDIIKTLVSASDGYFSFLGLQTGTYTAELDSAQLNALQIDSVNPIVFNIDNREEGAFVGGVDFYITKQSLP